MNDNNQNTPKPESTQVDHVERTKQVTVAGWTAGMTAFFAVGAVTASPSWPAAIGVAAVSAMVAVVCYFILKRA